MLIKIVGHKSSFSRNFTYWRTTGTPTKSSVPHLKTAPRPSAVTCDTLNITNRLRLLKGTMKKLQELSFIQEAATFVGLNMPGLLFVAWLIYSHALRVVPGDLHLFTAPNGQEVHLIMSATAWFIGESIAAVLLVAAHVVKDSALIIWGKAVAILKIAKAAVVGLLGVEVHENPLRN